MDNALRCLHAIHPDEEAVSERYIFGTVMLVVTVASIVLNVLLVIVLCRSNVIDKSVRPHIASMLVASLIFLFANCCILLPTILGHISIQDPYNTILATSNSIGYLMIMFTTTTMAIDRFLIFFMPKTRQLISNGSMLYVLSLIPCSMSLIFTVHMNIIGCRKRVNPFTMSYTYGCSDCGFYDPMLHAFAFAFPGMNFLIYMAVFLKIVQMKHTSRRSISTTFKLSYEIKLVTQFSLICAAQLASSAFFYILPPLMNGSDIAYYMTAVFSTLNTAVNPCVIISFQAKVRREIRILLTPGMARSSSVAWKTTVLPAYSSFNS